jgi:type IV pilus assembly protein PilE
MTKASNRNVRSGRLVSGFTLVELLVVVAIVASLAAIALPSYSSYIVKTRRTAAKACLTEVSNYMERFYTTNMKYTGATDPGLDCEGTVQTGNFYSWSVGTPAQSTYTITATPKPSQPDTLCGTLQLDQKGTRSPATTGCW